MAAHATARPVEELETRAVARAAVAAAAVGVFLTWTSDEPVQLDGVQGPNNGFLVLIVAALALAWTGSLARGSWIGVVGVLGASVVMGWTAVENWFDNRDVFGVGSSPGPILVLAGSLMLAGTALVHAVQLARRD